MKLDSECDIIRIFTNAKFTSLMIQSKTFSGDFTRAKLKQIGSDPFISIMRKLFIPKKNLMERVNRVIRMMGNAKWMSIHSRGFYESSWNETTRSLLCARAMYDKKYISHVFMATETSRMMNLATNYIPSEALFYVDKKLVDDSGGEHLDSYEIRDAMDIAVVEWFLVGEAVLVIFSYTCPIF